MMHRKTKLYCGQTFGSWVVFFALLIMTVVATILLVVVLPKAAEVHSCTGRATSLIERMGTNAVEEKRAYNRMKTIADQFGARPTGSVSLSNAIDWIVNEMKKDNITVRTDPVTVPSWTRGVESAVLISPLISPPRALHIQGLIGSVSGNVTANIVAVSSFDELAKINVTNKIVVYNYPWVSYDAALPFFDVGAILAAKRGAVGCLIRSATPFSLATLHVGSVKYESSTKQIPCATVTVEDSLMLAGLAESKQPPQIHLFLQEQIAEDVISHNIIAELPGDGLKTEWVVIGAHLDSVDIGQGVQDDLAGFVMAWEALRVMKAYSFVPTRGIRVVGWTGSETGMQGAKDYAAKYSHETVFAFEADEGVSKIIGLKASVFDEDGLEVLQSIGQVLEQSKGAGTILIGRNAEANINSLISLGVPGAVLTSLEGSTKYYWYHHSEADTIDKVDPDEFNEATAILAAYAFCVAELEKDIKKRA